MEDARPFLEWEIRRDDGRSTLVALAEDLEEELGASLGEWHIAKFIDDEELDGSKLGLEFGDAARHALPSIDEICA